MSRRPSAFELLSQREEFKEGQDFAVGKQSKKRDRTTFTLGTGFSHQGQKQTAVDQYQQKLLQQQMAAGHQVLLQLPSR